MFLLNKLVKPELSHIEEHTADSSTSPVEKRSDVTYYWHMGFLPWWRQSSLLLGQKSVCGDCGGIMEATVAARVVD